MNLRGDVVPRQPGSPREEERVVLCGFNSEIGEGQQKKTAWRLNETNSALLGRERASLPTSSCQVGPRASSLRRSLAAGDAEATKSDVRLSKDALKGKQDLGMPRQPGGPPLPSRCPWLFPGAICWLGYPGGRVTRVASFETGRWGAIGSFTTAGPQDKVPPDQDHFLTCQGP